MAKTKKTTKKKTVKKTTKKSAPEKDQKEKDHFRERYQFPSVVECPRCGCVDTVRTTQRDEIQYRQCEHPICRHYFQIVGIKIGGKKKI